MMGFRRRVTWHAVLLLSVSGCGGLFGETVTFDTATTIARIPRPMGVAVLPDGRIAATDTRNDLVVILSPDGAAPTTSDASHPVSGTGDAPGFLRPLKLAASPTTLYVTDFIADRVVRLDPDNGLVQGFWGMSGTAPGEMSSPTGIAIDAQGRVWITEFYNHRVQVFDALGHYLFGFGRYGKAPGAFRYPTGIAVSDDAVYVADGYNHRVQKLSLAGEPLDDWGTPLQLPWPFTWRGFFNVVSGIAVTDRWLFAADEFHDTIQVACHYGIWRGYARPGMVRHPSDLAVTPTGELVAADFGNDRIVKISWRVQ